MGTDLEHVALRPYLSEGRSELEHAAEILGCSKRSLQRRLAAAGVTYRELVSRLRFETAVDMLKRSEHPLNDIALELGYSDHSAFTRAFRHWSGIAPAEFRKRHSPEGAHSA